MLVLVTALPGEARPLIDRLKLKRCDDLALPVYAGQSLYLVQSGVGKSNAAAAVGYLQGLLGATKAAWLNIGIAGSGAGAIGDLLLGHKIVDAATADAWYPHFSFPPPCPTATLLTVDKPDNSYRDDVAVDMEASGFYTAASRFSSSELVHSLKVVSDSADAPISAIDRDLVEQLINRSLPAVIELIERLAPLAVELSARHAHPPGYEHCLQRWRFSATQRHQLARALRRWGVMAETDAPPVDKLAANTAGEALREMEARIAALNVNLIKS